MNADNTIYNLKGQAQKLQKGLEAIGKAVTRTQALDLVAQLQGKRDWKELTGLEQAAHAAHARSTSEAATRPAWLERLFYVLQLADFEEEDLDELVHEVIGGKEASWVNNQGMTHQLAVLLEAYGFNRKRLVQALEEHLEHTLAMPEGAAEQPAVPASLRICSGFPEEATHAFDALDWALQASANDLAAVIRGRYRSCDATDEIGLWMEQHAPNLEERTTIQELLAGMRAIVNIKPDRTGITLEVGDDLFSAFACLRHHYDSYSFDKTILKKLGVEA